MTFSPSEDLIKRIEKATGTLCQVAEIPKSQSINLDGLRALSEEMKDHIGRNDSARRHSAESASDFFVQ